MAIYEFKCDDEQCGAKFTDHIPMAEITWKTVRACIECGKQSSRNIAAGISVFGNAENSKPSFSQGVEVSNYDDGRYPKNNSFHNKQ